MVGSLQHIRLANWYSEIIVNEYYRLSCQHSNYRLTVLWLLNAEQNKCNKYFLQKAFLHGLCRHCSREAASDGRPHHQDATWTTSQSCYVMDSWWKWQETRSANKDMAVHIQRRPCGQRSRLEQRPGSGYRQAQMANSCCPLS